MQSQEEFSLQNLAAHINGVTIPIDDGYDIYINSKLCENRQKDAISHELRHIYGEHFYENVAIQILENEAENGPEPEKKSFILLN